MQVGPRRHPASIRTSQDVGAEHLRELLIADRFTTAVAVLTLLVLMFATAVSTWMLILIALIVVMGLVRQLGLRSLRDARTDDAVFWFAAGSWGVSIGAVLIVPISLPIVVITLAIPAVLSAMYQRDTHVRLVTAGLVIASGAAGAISRWTNGAGLEDDLHPDIVSLVFVGFLAAQSLPMVMAVRQASRQYRTSLDEAVSATSASQRAEAEVTRSRARLAQASDSERRKIERDLHDGAQQQFVSSLVQLRVLDQTVKRGRDPKPGMLAEIADDLEEAIDELRRLARGIYPSLLQTRGLFEALHGLARTSSASTSIASPDPGRMPHEVETAMYFFASEALQNVAKHAGPGAQAHVVIDVFDSGIRLQVRDDGVGITSDQRLIDSRGMVNMRDRIGAVGGTVAVASEPGAGCSVTAEVPMLWQAQRDTPGPLAKAGEPT